MIRVSYLIEQEGPDPVMVDEDNFYYYTVESGYDEGYVVYLVADDLLKDMFGNAGDILESLGHSNIETLNYEIRDNHPGWNDTYYILNENQKRVYKVYAVNYGMKEFNAGLV